MKAGSVRGTLAAMYSYTLSTVELPSSTLDVHLPPTVVAVHGRHPTYPPGVAQITLSASMDESFGIIFGVRTIDDNGRVSDSDFYSTNCIYALQMARVTFAMYGSCTALANLFQFSRDSTLEPTPPQPFLLGGGGYGG